MAYKENASGWNLKLHKGRDFWVLYSNGYGKHESLRKKKYVVKDAFYSGDICTFAINFSRIMESQKDKANTNDRAMKITET